MAFNIHLFICDNCRRYVRQLKHLIGAIPLMHRKASTQEVSTLMNHIHSHQD